MPKYIYIIYQNSAHTSQGTHYGPATKYQTVNAVVEIITVYCENNMEHINTLHRQTAEFFNSENI
jgi:hypothetical protein